MGFFSWNCNGCGHSILSNYSTNYINEWMQNTVAVKRRSGRILEGFYDGYGRIDGVNVHEGGNFNACVYHKACWELLGKPKKYKTSKSADDQGHFFKNEHDIEDPSPILKATLEELPTLLGKNPVWDMFIEARLKEEGANAPHATRRNG